MKKIFISYSQKDVELVRGIIEPLKAAKYEVWSDMEIRPGVEWDNAIAESLKNSDIYLLFITPNYIASSTVLAEYSKIFGYSEANDKIVIPVYIKDAQLPMDLSRVQYLDLRNLSNDESANRIIATIQRLEGQKIAKQEKIEQTKEQIAKSIAEYVVPTINELKERERKLKGAAMWWNITGYFSLLLGVAASVTILLLDNTQGQEIDWQKVLYAAVKGTIILILLLASSKYSFTLAKAFMNEALKNSDRIHAISFGRFYLQAFEEKINPTDFKEVFQHWNTNSNSSFSTISSDNYDPKISETTGKILDIIKEAAGRK